MTSSDPDGGNDIIKERIDEAQRLLSDCEHSSLAALDGCSKLTNKIRAELRFLQSLDASDERAQKKVETSNVVHFTAIVATIKECEGCVAVLKSFPVVTGKNARKEKLVIDVVGGGGSEWVKVICRNPRNLHAEYVGADDKNGRSLSEQAELLTSAAEHYPHHFRPPRVIFSFARGVPSALAAELRAAGVLVRGVEVPSATLGSWAADSTDDEDDDAAEGCSGAESAEASPSGAAAQPDCDVVNLDVTAMVVLTSELTNGGAAFHFRESGLDSQARLERQSPALPVVRRFIRGKRLICCQTAFDSFSSILATIAGEKERRRAAELFERVQVVADCASERVDRLVLSDRISRRAKATFACGDVRRAVTLTANRHFLQAAEHQGVRLAAFLHESRALTEQKQVHARPIVEDDSSMHVREQ